MTLLPFLFPLQYALLENLIDQTTANIANDAYDVCKGNLCSCIVFNVTHEIFYHQKLLILSLSALPVGLLDIHLWPVAFVECQVCTHPISAYTETVNMSSSFLHSFVYTELRIKYFIHTC